MKFGRRVSEKLGGGVELGDTALVEEHHLRASWGQRASEMVRSTAAHPVIVDDRAQSVRDREDSALSEFSGGVMSSLRTDRVVRFAHCLIVLPISSSVA